MLTRYCRFVGLGWLVFATGCAMCSNCDDVSYSSFAGRWQRLDPSYGRVGSAFTPEVGMRVDDQPLDPTVEEIAPGEPTPAPADESTPAPGDSTDDARSETSVLQPRDLIAR